MTDNIATLKGYTIPVIACGDFHELYLLVKPDTDMSGSFRAWDTDEQEWLNVNGWLFDCEVDHGPNHDSNGNYCGTPANENGWTA